MWSVQAGALSVCSRVERGRRGAAAEGDGSMATTGRPSQRRLPLVSRPARLPLHRTSSYASHLSVCNTQHFAAARERSTVMCVSVSQQRRVRSSPHFVARFSSGGVAMRCALLFFVDDVTSAQQNRIVAQN